MHLRNIHASPSAAGAPDRQISKNLIHDRVIFFNVSGGKAMLQRREWLLLVVGILAGAVAGLVVGYGIHGTPAQDDVGLSQNNGSVLTLGGGQMKLDDMDLTDQQFADQMAAMKNRSEQLTAYNRQLEQLRAQLANVSESGNLQEYANLTQQIEDLKGLIDGLNDDSQQDMIQLQGQFDERNNHYEIMFDNRSKYWGQNDAGQLG
jgi:hypothetical protein